MRLHITYYNTYTINFTILQERYHGVQDVMTTPWPLT